jgi:hypothetical protein
MKTNKLEIIISIIDKEIERLGIEYLTPPQANKLLEDKGVLSDSKTRSGKSLREILRMELISHAYQINNKWRIPHSLKNKNEISSSENKSIADVNSIKPIIVNDIDKSKDKRIKDKISKIISAIDNELINNGKQYLLIGEAKLLLLKNNIITYQEKYNQYLEKLLLDFKIPHAYKVNNRWRIPLSKKGKEANLLTKSKSIGISNNISTIKQSSKQVSVNLIEDTSINCPLCKSNINIPKYLKNEVKLHCPDCDKDFINPIKSLNNPISKPNNYNINKNKYYTKEFEKKFMLVFALILLVMYILGLLLENPERDREEYIQQQKNIYKYEKEKQATDDYYNNLKEQAKKEVDNEK